MRSFLADGFNVAGRIAVFVGLQCFRAARAIRNGRLSLVVPDITEANR